ncbi:uncharacterized protein CEXT_436511 [Caerostris extrusa]|uniref:Uncharacterized protein n=1 Tax=Caerostris extrusa TaxID=172846 RepID=A0AAV4M6B5_CAEEX|nr:uncharacterized protein CEXT_436511 [Caerostris extrusa]
MCLVDNLSSKISDIELTSMDIFCTNHERNTKEPSWMGIEILSSVPFNCFVYTRIYIACMLIKNYENLPLNTNRKCSFLIYVSQSKYVVVCVTFMWSFLDQYLDWSIHFLVAVLYCFSCRQTTSSINKLCSEKQHFQSQTAWQKYFSVRKCLKEIEERYSFLIFVLMGRSFVEFFRVLTFLLDVNAAAEDVLFSVLATFYSSIIFAVFLRVALSASGLLTSYRRLREMMTELPRDLYCFDEDLEASRLFMRICADK